MPLFEAAWQRILLSNSTMETSLLARLLGLARTVTPLAPINAAALTLPQLELGQSVRAQITARLADGSFRVTIKDVPLRVALPPDTKTGDIVTLRLVAREPHLEFAIERPVESANLRLSGAGRLIGEVLREPLESRPQQLQPVTAKPTIDAAALREPLARAIQRSGLFYESHQARWIEGDYPLALLNEEPQAVLTSQRNAGRPELAGAWSARDGVDADQVRSFNRTPSPESSTPPSHEGRTDESGGTEAHRPADARNAPGNRVAATDTPDTTRTPPSALTAGQARLIETGEFAPFNPGSAATPGTEDRAQPGIARELMPIVRQQLETIETRQILWQGELWPGQFMRWQIADHESDAKHGQSEREWLTRFALQLATLGAVNADVAVGASGIRVRISAEASATADALRAAMPELAEALQKAGLRVTLLEVRHHAR